MTPPAADKRPASSQDEPSLLRRLHGVLPIGSAAAAAQVAAWRASIAGSGPGNALAALTVEHPTLERLLIGIAAASPYLWDLICADAARLVRICTCEPEREFAALLAAAERSAATARAPEQIVPVLRRMKADAALLIALADIGGIWPVVRVTQALTDLADTALRAAVHCLLCDAVRRGKLRPDDPDAPEQSCGYIVLAMGKMGGRELNFSSDIDLIVFFDRAAARLAPEVEPSQFFVRLTRDLVKLLQQRTSDGYVFRVDLRLRPDPSSTQIAISTEAALDYYESRGQNWERAALIKARQSAGDTVAGAKLLRELSQFIWRKYLDYATIADVHAMKQRIHAYRGHGAIAVEGHNIKLGRGGIREIEFFAQTQQLIAGGRHPELRGRETAATLATLADGGWIDATVRDALTEAYYFLRRVEHRLQMVNDEQTHTLPSDRETLDRFAKFLGCEGREEFAELLLTHLRQVERHYVRLFEHAPAALAEQQQLVLDTPQGESEALDRFARMGFHQPPAVLETVRRWHAGESRALRGEQARHNLMALTPLILEQLARAENPDAALFALDRFVAALRAGGRFFSLLRQNPELIRFIALILGVAPRLADILAQNPHLIDALIDPSFFGALPDEAKLETELNRALAETRNYEEVLDAIRLFGQQHMFLIGARILSGTVSAAQAGALLARLADILVRAVHQKVEQDFALTYGRISGQQTAIVALGRLGAREMTANSDLDLIVIYDFDQRQPASDGTRSLYGAQYFARLTQRLISALAVQTNYGVLYQVDMRLRPSGRAGPLATQIYGFSSYQGHEAWTWEHMALTRARVISGSPAFTARVEAVIHDVLCRERDRAVIASDVVDMRAAIAREKGDSNPWDLKYAAGGLVDIEFIAQYLELVHAATIPEILDVTTAGVLEKAERLGVLSAEDAAVLRPAVRLFHDLIQVLRLCLTGAFDPRNASAGVQELLARAADLPDFAALEAHVEETRQRVRECFVRIFGRAP